MRNIKLLSIVVPFHNEQDNISMFYTGLVKHLSPLKIPYELLCVDDGSTDQTETLLKDISKRDKSVKVISLSRNFGHQVALTAGLDQCTGDAVIVMDSDLQHPPSLIQKMVSHFQAGSEVVYAVRKISAKSRLKMVTEAVFYTLLKHLSSTEIISSSPDFRQMSKHVVHTLREMREYHRYLRGMVSWLDQPYSVVQYDQSERFAGRSSYTLKKSITLAVHAIFSFSLAPLHLITWIGLSSLLCAVMYLIYIFVMVVTNQTIPGWASIIVVSPVMNGASMLSLGIIAQYIGMIFEQVKQRPLYVLKAVQTQDRKNQRRKRGTIAL